MRRKKTIENKVFFPVALLCLCLSALLLSCSGGQGRVSSSAEGDTTYFKYARNICVVDCGDHRKVVLKNPWSGEEGWKEYPLDKPSHRLLVSTSVHCSVFEELGCASYVKGVCESDYIKLTFVKSGLEKGDIKDCGSSMQPDLEKVVELQPDLVLLSPFQGSTADRRVASAGFTVVELADYMEHSPLARAEWIIFYGMLVGKEKEAREIFAKVESEYLEYKEKAARCKTRPTVMFDKMVQATWFVPGGQSTIGQMTNDANCQYVFADNTSNGSLELSYEQVVDKAIDADLWLLRFSDADAPDYSLKALGEENSKYKVFKPFKAGKVYGCDVSHTQFFEETPFHPERLLRDFVLIAHPETAKQGMEDKANDQERTVYFHKL